MTAPRPSFVIDASVAMAWVFEDEATADTDVLLEQLRTASALVPSLWPFEVTNVLAVAERRGRISEAQAVQISRLLAALPIAVDQAPVVLDELTATARHHDLSSYDAAYLMLALHRGLPLATLDRRLREAAASAGVSLLPTAVLYGADT